MESLTALIASAILAASIMIAPAAQTDSQQLEPPTGEEQSYPVGPPTAEVSEQ